MKGKRKKNHGPTWESARAEIRARLTQAKQFEDYESRPENMRPAAPLHHLRDARREVERAVLEMRMAGYSWSAVGMTLGVTAQDAERLYEAGPANNRIDECVAQLREEFGDPITVWGHTGVDAWHVVVGMFSTTGWDPSVGIFNAMVDRARLVASTAPAEAEREVPE